MSEHKLSTVYPPLTDETRVFLVWAVEYLNNECDRQVEPLEVFEVPLPLGITSGPFTWGVETISDPHIGRRLTMGHLPPEEVWPWLVDETVRALLEDLLVADRMGRDKFSQAWEKAHPLQVVDE